MTLVEKNSIRAEDITERYIGGLLSGGGYPEPNTPANWADMVNGFQDFALASHLGIPLIYGVDAVHGHGNLRGATIFPHYSGLGAANNPDLMTRIGQVTAAEMIATGIYWNYGPAVSVPQDIRWGRTYEGYSENPELVSVLGTAYLRGLQVGDPAGGLRVLATPKHFVGDGGTAWGSSTTGSYLIDQGVTEVDEATLRALHLPPYVALVTAINAGIDMNMVPYDYHRFIDTLTRAVDAGDVSKDRIDDAVRRILTVKFELGLFEQPYSDPALLALVGSSEHRLVAREAVAQSQVLLKNEGGLLPLATDIPALYVGGQAADDIGIQAGGWTIEWQGKPGDITSGTTVLAAIQDTVSPDTDVVYDKFGRFPDGAAADPAAACIAVVGEEPYAEGHGDSADLRLPVNDLRVLGRMREQCHRLIVLLITGRSLIVTELIDNWDALVMSWLPGTEGQGVADVLFGRVPFSGRLPYTWPRSVDQLPLVGG